MKRGRALAMLVAPLLAACGAIIGAEWDGTLRSAEIDGSPGDEESDTDASEGRDSSVALDAADAADTRPIPKTCSGDAKFCVCRANMPKEDGGVLCSVPSVGGRDAGFCCEDKNYPLAGKCTCSEFKCNRTSADYCACGPLGGGDGGITSCSGAVCCYSPGIAQCTCYDTGIQDCLNITGPEVRVASCTLDTVPCGTNERRTTDCGFVVAQ